MCQPGRDLDLGEEALRTEERGDLGAKHLERDRTAVFEVLGEQDDRGRPMTDLAVDAVAVGEGAAQRVEAVSHAVPGSVQDRRKLPRRSAWAGDR
jgi:hypothetical protein